MVLRRLALRHSRRALEKRLTPPPLRAFTTRPEAIPTLTPIAVADPPPAQNEYASSHIAPRADPRHGGRLGDISKKWASVTRAKKSHGKIGAVTEKPYHPGDVIADPPRPENVTLEMLMAAQTHMGHHKSMWNPANSRYIYGVRQGIHIISLEQTAAHLRRAARVVEEVSYQGGLVLFSGTRKGHMPIVARAAEMAGACHIFTKWIPGAITNRDIILASKAMNVVDEHDRKLSGFQPYSAQRRPLVPDLVVSLNPRENFVMLYECGLQSIPTIGVIDTNTDPSWVTYAVPANDDSLRSIAVVAGVLGRAGEAGRKRRLEDARQGRVPWTTEKPLRTYIGTTMDWRQSEVKHAKFSSDKRAATRSWDHEEDRDEEAILLGLQEGTLNVPDEDVISLLAQTVDKTPESEHLPEAPVVEDVKLSSVLQSAPDGHPAASIRQVRPYSQVRDGQAAGSDAGSAALSEAPGLSEDSQPASPSSPEPQADLRPPQPPQSFLQSDPAEPSSVGATAETGQTSSAQDTAENAPANAARDATEAAPRDALEEGPQGQGGAEQAAPVVSEQAVVDDPAQESLRGAAPKHVARDATGEYSQPSQDGTVQAAPEPVEASPIRDDSAKAEPAVEAAPEPTDPAQAATDTTEAPVEKAGPSSQADSGGVVTPGTSGQETSLGEPTIRADESGSESSAPSMSGSIPEAEASPAAEETIDVGGKAAPEDEKGRDETGPRGDGKA